MRWHGIVEKCRRARSAWIADKLMRRAWPNCGRPFGVSLTRGMAQFARQWTGGDCIAGRHIGNYRLNDPYRRGW